MAIPAADHAKHPVTIAAGPYGHPFHPMIVTIPIGCWIAALVFDVGSQISGSPSHALVVGSEWLIAIGVIGALIAAFFGLTDLSRVPNRTVAFRIGIAHMLINVGIIALFIANFFWRWTTVTSNTQQVEGGMLALTAIGVGFLLVSGALGGTLAYRFGVRVADEVTQSEGFRPA